MGPERKRVLAYVREHPGAKDYEVHRGVGSLSYLPESTVKHLLRLRDAGLVRSDGSARVGLRRWYPAGDAARAALAAADQEEKP